jgi:uncharacterized membrane protein YfhO
MTIDGNTIMTSKEDASMTIRVNGVTRSQLIISFDNLRRLNDKGESIGDFVVKASNSKLKFDANNKKNTQTIPGIVDFDLNMGYYDTYSGNIKIKLSKAGRYEFDRLYVSAMSVDNFDKYAQERMKSVYEVSERKSDRVTGTLNAEDDGWLFLSMPINDNWNVFIDGGQVAEIHNANYAFFATPVTKGNHTVEIRYDYTSRYIALGITVAGLVLTVLISVFERRLRRKRSSGESTYEKH